MPSETSPEVTAGCASQVDGSPHDLGHVGCNGADLEDDDEEPSTSAAFPRQ